MSSFISVTFGSFKNSFQKYSFSSFLKEAFANVVFSLSYIEHYFFDLSCCFTHMVERGSIFNAGKSLLSKQKKIFRAMIFQEKRDW